MGRIKGFNKYEIRGDITVIFIQRKNGEIIETIIDTEDLEKIKALNYSWNVKWERSTRSYYVRTVRYLKDKNGETKPKYYYLHSMIMNSDGSVIVDHINNDTLDNRKENLRFVTKQENISNRKGANINSKTGIRNVNWIERENEYWVQFTKNYQRYWWKFPADKFEEACKFAEQKRIEIFGKINAKVNVTE